MDPEEDASIDGDGDGDRSIDGMAMDQLNEGDGDGSIDGDGDGLMRAIIRRNAVVFQLL